MSITLNYTTIDDCEDASNWSAVGSGGNVADSDYPSKEGTQCIEFDCASGKTDSGVKSPTVTGFDIRTYEVSLWFLNPKVNDSGDELITASNSALKLRLYSGSNWADFYQSNHRGPDGDYNGGWLYLRASGGPGAEDANSGTWGTSQVSSVTAVAVLLSTQGDNTGKNAAEYGVDWCKYYDKIVVTGYKTGTTPYSLDDIYTEDTTKSSGGGVWGVVNKFENYFNFYCGLEFGDGTNNGALTTTNEYIYLNQSSSAQDYDVTVKNHFTLTLGAKVIGSDDTYAKDGTPLVVSNDPLFKLSSPVKPSPDLVIQSGGVFKCYASLITGFGTVNLGSGGSSTIEFIKCSLYNNTTLELRSTGLSFTNVRIHFPGTSKAAIGKIYNIPSLLRLKVFQITDGFEVRVNTLIEEYYVSDSTYDLVVLEGKTVRLLDSNFSSSKLKRVAS